VVLNAVTQEDTDLFTPMTSRIVHLVLIDLLATVVALRMGKIVEENIKSIKKISLKHVSMKFTEYSNLDFSSRFNQR